MDKTKFAEKKNPPENLPSYGKTKRNPQENQHSWSKTKSAHLVLPLGKTKSASFYPNISLFLHQTLKIIDIKEGKEGDS